MLYPSINELLKKVDNRYTLVMMASKRARQLMNGDKSTVDSKSRKPVSIATQEISENKIGYTRPAPEDLENQDNTENSTTVANDETLESI